MHSKYNLSYKVWEVLCSKRVLLKFHLVWKILNFKLKFLTQTWAQVISTLPHNFRLWTSWIVRDVIFEKSSCTCFNFESWILWCCLNLFQIDHLRRGLLWCCTCSRVAHRSCCMLFVWITFGLGCVCFAFVWYSDMLAQTIFVLECLFTIITLPWWLWCMLGANMSP